MTLLLLLILFVTTLPVFLWRRTRAMGIYILGLYVGYCFLTLDWLYGNLTFCHDTYQGYQFYFNITRQWVKTGTEFGWNPYLGAGQPMSLMSNLVFWVPAILLAKAEMILNASLSSFKFANLVYLSIMFFSATGMVLLLQLLFRNIWVTFFGATVFVWGGMFVYNLHQMWPTLFAYPLTYPLFFLFHSYKTRTWPGLLLLALFCGSLANHYIPLYVYTTLLLIVVGLFCFASGRTKNWLRRLKPSRHLHHILACILLFAISASPTLYSYFEMQDYISPSRGFTERGTVTSQDSGNQIAVAASLSTYLSLIKPLWNPEGSVHYHMAAYLGVVPGLLIFSFLPLALARDRIMRTLVFTTLVLVLLGTGNDTPAWGLLVDHVPLFNMLRHPACFSSIITLLAIVISAGCLNVVLKIKHWGIKEGGMILAGFMLYFFFMGVDDSNLEFDIKTIFEGGFFGFGAISLIALAILGALSRYPHRVQEEKQIRFEMLPVAFLLFVNLSQLAVYTWDSVRISPSMKGLEIVKWDLLGVFLLTPKEGLCRIPDYEPAPMRYPVHWISRCAECKEDYAPFQITPMIFKQAIWTHPLVDFMFLLQKDFAEMYHFPLADLNTKHKVLGGNIFYLAPDDSGWSFDRNGFSWLDRLQERRINLVGMPDSKNWGTVESIPSDNPNRISVKVNATRDLFLLRMENFHEGWQATIDGQPVAIKRARPNFQTLAVTRGEHLIEFKFESMYPILVWASLGITLLGWFVVSFWLYRSGSKLSQRA